MIGPLSVPVFIVLLVGGVLLLVFGTLGVVFGLVRRRYGPDARILQKGELAEATILRSWQTGVRVMNRFGIGLELDVRRVGYPAYRAQARTLISILDAAKFQAGMVLAVRVDPERPERVYMEPPPRGVTGP